MARLEDLTPGTLVKGIVDDATAELVSVKWHGSDVLEVVCKDSSGRLGTEILFRDREPSLQILTAGRPWSFDRDGNPFIGEDSDRLIAKLDILAGDKMFARLREPDVTPYDLVIFDEAHKLSADRGNDMRVRQTDRYRLAEALAGVPGLDHGWRLPWHAQHLLLLTATPHKVYDVIGRVLAGVSIRQYMEHAVTDGADEVAQNLDGRLTKEQVAALAAREKTLYGSGGDVARELPRLRDALSHETYCRLLPGYWLYAVYECATPSPRLARVQDPFGTLLAKAKGSVLISPRDILQAATETS